MIAFLRGLVQHIGEGELVLEVGGVGLSVTVPKVVLEEAPAIGQPMFLHTYFVVRDASLSLYGFSTVDQRELFELLLQVNGVGPKLAIAVLSYLSPDVIRSAVVNNQPEVLSRVPGVGRKTAQKMIFHLKDRLVAPLEEIGLPSEIDTEVLSVLTALGYSLVEAQTALGFIPEDAPQDVEGRVKFALKYFARP
ncbi:MAG TPA: Holliday junction branch migration protein RuvA [Anaerolineae bacterium]|nr:Holliday junction branch migration protein RuvA [Anaerolineae bacterium]